MRVRLTWVLATLGSVLMTAGLVAGVINHEIVNGSRFAQHVDNIRQDPAVARQLGDRLSARVLEKDPDLVAVKPLLDNLAVALVSSSAFSPIVQKSASELHAAFTQNEPAVLRLADVGAVVSGVLQQADPAAAARLPADLDVTLSDIGSQSFASESLKVVNTVNVLAWLLPLLAVLCLVAAVVVTEERRRTAPLVGWAIAVSGVLLAGLVLVVTIWTSFVDTDTLEGAMAVAAWHELRSPFWWTVAGAVVGGLVLAAALETGSALEPRRLATFVRQWSVGPTHSTRHLVVRAATFVVVGLLLVVQSGTMLRMLAVVLGVWLAALGAEQLSAVGRGWVADRLDRRPGGWSPQLTRGLAGGFGVVVIVALVSVLAAPTDEKVPEVVVSTGSGPCNGHVELCDRRYDEVAFPATHNSMSAADFPNWFLPEQPTGLVGQLEDGIRVLLIDTWYGQTTRRPGVVATSERLQETATRQLTKEYGQAVVESALRLRDAGNLTPTGPEEPYLCHGFCELGATLLEPNMEQVAGWMGKNPRDVVTLFIQDEVTPEDTAEVLDEAGLLPYVWTQEPGQPWPTLGEMITSGRRLVVLMENHGGGATYPWMLQGFDWVQDTPYDPTKVSQFSCRLNRGAQGDPIFLINHWLNNPQSRVSDAKKVNAFDVLWPRVKQCEEERTFPNYVAVDFYDQGDLLAVIDRLNGFD